MVVDGYACSAVPFGSVVGERVIVGARFVSVKLAFAAPGVRAVTLYVPAAPFALALTLATPLAFVTAGLGVPRVAVAGLPGAVNVTATPLKVAGASAPP